MVCCATQKMKKNLLPLKMDIPTKKEILEKCFTLSEVETDSKPEFYAVRFYRKTLYFGAKMDKWFKAYNKYDAWLQVRKYIKVNTFNQVDILSNGHLAEIIGDNYEEGEIPSLENIVEWVVDNSMSNDTLWIEKLQ